MSYGYRKSEEDKNRIVVDEYAAGVVKDIFRMKLLGMSQQAIADTLNEKGILPPLAYKNSIGIRLKTSFDMGETPEWNPVSVTRVLKNELYTGVLIQGKQTTPNYKVKTRVMKPESQWARIEDSHEAVISRQDFDLVQELLRLIHGAPREVTGCILLQACWCAETVWRAWCAGLFRQTEGSMFIMSVLPIRKISRSVHHTVSVNPT